MKNHVAIIEKLQTKANECLEKMNDSYGVSQAFEAGRMAGLVEASLIVGDEAIKTYEGGDKNE